LNYFKAILFIFFYSFVESQETLQVEEIRSLIKESMELYIPNSNLTKNQEKLLKQKNKEKIEQELILLDSLNIVIFGDVYDKVNSIFENIKNSNKQIPAKSKLVILKSTDFNAFTMGDNVVFVHVGLLYQLKNDEEIAFVLSHELAHNILKHVDKALVDYVLFQTNDTINSEIKSISKQKYGKTTAYNQLLTPRILENREKSRLNEFDADSLGIVFTKNAGYNIEKAVVALKKMEDVSLNKSSKLDIQSVFKLTNDSPILVKYDKYKYSNSLGAFDLEAENELKKYLSTHPYEKDRLYKIVKFQEIDTLKKTLETEGNNTYYQAVSQLMINSSLKEKNISMSIYYLIKHVEIYPLDIEMKKNLIITLNSLSFLKEIRKSGKFLNLESNFLPEEVNKLSNLLRGLTPQECSILSESIKSSFDLEVLNSSPSTAFIKLFTYSTNQDSTSFENLWASSKSDIYASSFGWMLKEFESFLYFKNEKVYKFLKINKK
jgi:hypothetical protein